MANSTYKIRIMSPKVREGLEEIYAYIDAAVSAEEFLEAGTTYEVERALEWDTPANSRHKNSWTTSRKHSRNCGKCRQMRHTSNVTWTKFKAEAQIMNCSDSQVVEMVKRLKEGDTIQIDGIFLRYTFRQSSVGILTRTLTERKTKVKNLPLTSQAVVGFTERTKAEKATDTKIGEINHK